jgi:hypothetical protein
MIIVEFYMKRETRIWKTDQLNENNSDELDTFLEMDAFALIRFQSDRSKKLVYYVGKILEHENDDGDDFQVFS